MVGRGKWTVIKIYVVFWVTLLVKIRFFFTQGWVYFYCPWALKDAILNRGSRISCKKYNFLWVLESSFGSLALVLQSYRLRRPEYKIWLLICSEIKTGSFSPTSSMATRRLGLAMGFHDHLSFQEVEPVDRESSLLWRYLLLVLDLASGL